MSFLEKVAKRIKERREVSTFCMNKNCCIVACRYNSKRTRNPKTFAFFEGTNKCKKIF